MAEKKNPGRVSGGPAGFRGSRDPDGAVEIQGITARQFSEQQYQDLQNLADNDRWAFSDDAYLPRNVPEILRQHNPLVIPEQYRDWPEVWFVHVPMTAIAWNNRQIIHEHQHRVDPQFLPEYQRLDNDQWEAEFSAFDAAHKKKIAAYQHNQAALTEKIKRRQTVAFPSYKEAEAFAQDAWRTFWADVADKRHDPKATAFRQNAVLNQMRRVENFYCDMDNPAHVEQLKVWEAGFPDGLPQGVVVTKHHDPRVPALIAAAEAKAAAYNTMSWADGIVEADSSSVTERQPDRLVHPALRTASDGTWMIVPVKLDAGEAKTWVVAQWDRDQGWQFWRNGTGRPMAFQDDSAEAVARRLPEAVRAGLERFDPTLPSSGPAELGELWRMARDPHLAATGSPEFREWTQRERELALARQAQWERAHRENPAAAPDDAMSLYRDPVVQAIVAVHEQVSPRDGIMPAHPGQLEKAQVALEAAITQHVPNPEDRDVLTYLARRWHTVDGDLAKQSLGIFKTGRVADNAFTDLDVENGVRIDGTGDWVGTPLPSGHMIVAKLGPNDQPQWVKPMAFPSQQAAYDDVVSMGGYLQIQERRDVRDLWAAQQARHLGPGGGWIADSLAGKLPLTTDAQNATATRWELAKLPSNQWMAAVVNAEGKPVALKPKFYRHAEEARRDLPGGSTLRVAPSVPDVNQGGHAQTARILTATLSADIRRRWERKQLRAERAANPKPVEASPAPKVPSQLFVTPIGADRAVVTALPRDKRRKNLEPELVVWKNGELVGLNKNNHSWLPKLKPGETRDLASIPEAKRPWIVTSDKGIAGLVDAVRERVPEAKVTVEPMIPANVVVALKERYSVDPVPLKNKEAWWALHPAPAKHTVMATHREWTLEPKPAKYPGEYTAVAICVPLKRNAESPPATWASVVEAEQALRSSGLAYHQQKTMPPEVTYMFDQKLAPKAPKAAPPVAIAPEADPIDLLRTRATRFHRETFWGDLHQAQEELGLPESVRVMQNRVASVGLWNGDVHAFDDLLPELAEEAGVSWEQTVQNVQDYARHWIDERPKIAQRLVADPHEPARVRAPRPSGVSVALS